MKTEWIVDKIISYLETKEGFRAIRIEKTGDVDSVLVSDSLGFIYEIQVKTIGRTYEPSRNMPPGFRLEMT